MSECVDGRRMTVDWGSCWLGDAAITDRALNAHISLSWPNLLAANMFGAITTQIFLTQIGF